MKGQADQVEGRTGPYREGEAGRRRGMGADAQRGSQSPSHILPRASPPSHLTLHFCEIMLIHSEHFMGKDCTPPHTVILHKDTDDGESLLLTSSGKPLSVSH